MTSHGVGQGPRGMTLVSLVRARAEEDPSALAFALVVDGDEELTAISCLELEREARRVASLVADSAPPGSRAVLLYEPGLDFLGAFFGCLFAGVTAVPVYPPFPQQLEAGLARMDRVLRDAGARLVLASDALVGLAELMPGERSVSWLPTSTGGDPDGWSDPRVTPETVAIMQYTSGSTSEPRGVVLQHRHVIANLGAIDWFLGGAAHGPSVSWLPTYHDMGLVGGVIYNLSRGRPTYLLSPLHFLKRPGRWLQLVSKVGATVTGGPNFAYELAVRRTTEEERAGMDLSCLDIAFNGAEPIRAESVHRFESSFAPQGLRPGTVLGCYGLAEASLLVTGAQRGGRRFAEVDRRELELGRAIVGRGLLDASAEGIEANGSEASKGPGGPTAELVSSGEVPPGHDVRIVDPATGVELPAGRIGEIWFSGDSVAAGYWRRPEETHATFGAIPAANGQAGRRFLRTGDLGFFLDGSLFVSGRLKDLVVLRGRNIQPQDVELAAQQADPRLRAGRGVAFAIETDLGEGVGLVQETAEEDPEVLVELAREARRGVMEALQVSLAVLWLVPPRAIHTTANGKLQRRSTRSAIESGSLAVLHESRRPGPEPYAEREREAIG